MNIEAFFTLPFATNALDAYYGHRNTSWPLSNKIRVYNLAKIAFDLSRNTTEITTAFEEVYAAVRAFSAFRNASGPCWDAGKAFHVLSSECTVFSRSSDRTLINLSANDHGEMMKSLDALTDIKPLAGRYPFVPVSKLLHFYNPLMFPMYDEEFIWKRVCWGAFRQDYERFCKENNYVAKEFGGRFNLQYTHWAANIMVNADPDLMRRFSEWFKTKVSNDPDPQNILKDIKTYYSVAFEFIALGGAFLEGWV